MADNLWDLIMEEVDASERVRDLNFDISSMRKELRVLIREVSYLKAKKKSVTQSYKERQEAERKRDESVLESETIIQRVEELRRLEISERGRLSRIFTEYRTKEEDWIRWIPFIENLKSKQENHYAREVYPPDYEI